jgi:hypothetical protein
MADWRESIEGKFKSASHEAGTQTPVIVPGASVNAEKIGNPLPLLILLQWRTIHE